jgi:adenylylsulfate kinase
MSWAIWITGQPGSGKSALARAAAAELQASGDPVIVLELDEIRKIITPSPTDSDIEREIVYRALVYMAAAVTEYGTPVIIDATAHRREWRELARRLIPRFAEVQLECPLDERQKREWERTHGNAPPEIYARGGGPGARVSGVDLPYEASPHAELTVDTQLESAALAARRIVELARRLGKSSWRRVHTPSSGWAIWISGLPGSGKTTLAWGTAKGLAARSVHVRILEFAEIRRALLGDYPESDTAADIVHRALAYTAKLLTDTGLAVIVDATSPRRVWRELARNLIMRFAEVQLVCAREICTERERATRWHLGAERHSTWSYSPANEVPDIVMHYEEPLCPELILHTDTQDSWGTLDELLRLALRLHRTAAVEAYGLLNPKPNDCLN